MAVASVAPLARRRSGFVLVLFALCLCQQRCLCVDQVPVLLWSTQSSLWSSVPPPHAGHVVSESQLQRFLEPVPRTHRLLLFVQDKLSVDDFTRFGAFAKRNENVFSSVQTALRSSPSSLVLSAVDWRAANGLAAQLSGLTVGAVTELQDFPAALSSLTPGAPGLTLVHLPATTSASEETRGVALAKNDEIIGQVVKLLKDEGQSFTAIYTALRPSKVLAESNWARDESAADWHTNRHLLQAAAAAATAAPPPAGSHAPLVVLNGSDPCIVFWAERILVGFGKDAAATYDLTNDTFSGAATGSSSECAADNSTLFLSYKHDTIPSLPVTTLTIEIKFSQRDYPVSGRNWLTLEELTLKATNGTAGAVSWNATERYTAHWASSPSEFSYSCGAVDSDPRRSGMLLVSDSGSEALPAVPQTLIHFSIAGFQLQGPTASHNRTGFAYASDCAAFFTPAIWMGLVSCFVLLLILTYALHMLSSIKTMDRFDDPKAPGLTIPQTD